MNPIIMALLLAVSLGIFAWSFMRRWKLLMVGSPEMRWDNVGERIKRTWVYAFAQKRMTRYTWAGVAHRMIFTGFMVLLIRSLILFSRGFIPDSSLLLFQPHTLLGDVYSLLKDIFVVLVMLGAIVFLYYRLVVKLPRMTKSTEGVIILGIIVVMMVADVLYDGAWMVLHVGADANVGFNVWEPAGSVMALMLQNAGTGMLTFLAHAGFWIHVSLVLIFLNVLPYSKHFHIITAIPNVFLQDLNPKGRLAPIVDIEGKLEREETLGIKSINQFSWKSILDFYTCTECGRCSDQCPANNTGKKLSPKHFTVDLRNFLYENEKGLVAGKNGTNGNGTNGHGSNGGGESTDEGGIHYKDLIDGVIDPEVLWACTTCRACETECPVFITYVDKIVDMRRYLVQERGEFPNELQTAFRGLESNMNPWGFAPDERANWASGLDVPLIAENPEADVLFWVGCAPSYDDRAKKTARATAILMKQAGVNFAILGPEEQCTGDPARRAGNEFLFQMFAEANTETLNGYNVKKIVTTCPHCYNTLDHEYGDYGGHYEVVHHSDFLADLVRSGKLKPTQPVKAKVVYHDSCYLGRYNDMYDSPRDLLRSIPGVTLVEPVETRDRGMCCGAGGAQMFKEEESGEERVNERRTEQLLKTDPNVVSSACPFCMRMLTDGLAGKDREDVEQLDIAEMLLRSVGETPNEATPETAST